MKSAKWPNISVRKEACPDHGEYESRNLWESIWSRCPVCTGIEQAAKEAKKAEDERIERRIAWQRRIGCAGIPERFKDRTLDSYVADTPAKKRALDFSLEYALNFKTENAPAGRSALFVGKPGTGKTHLAVGIAHSVMEQGYSALFCTVLRAVRRVTDTWSGARRESQSEAISSMVFPDLLILDEVGIQHGSETEKLIIFDILNERYEKSRPCIFLSNLEVDEVSAYLGERIIDRMREDGGEVVPFTWESHRGR